MNDKEIRDRIQNRLGSATMKIDAARSAAYREQYNSAAEWLEQAAEKVKQARAFIGRIGEDK
jgi:alkylation response protein AidB-like acyl-CoA dehydrogenase